MEVQYNIFGLLDPRSLLNCSTVSRSWKEMTKDDWIWDEKLAERWQTIEPPVRVSGVSAADQYAEEHRIERNWMNQHFKRHILPITGMESALDFRTHGYSALCEEASLDAESDLDTARARFEEKYDHIREDSIFAVASANGSAITVGNIWKQEARKVLRGHVEPVTSLAFAGAHSLISGDAQGGLVLWDLYRSDAPLPWSVTSSEFVGKRVLKRASVTALSVFDSQMLVGNANGDISFLDVDRGMYPLQTLVGAQNAAISKFAQSKSDPHLVASASHGPIVKLWDSRSGFSATALYADTSSIRCVQFGFEHQLLTGGPQGVRLWDLRMSAVLHKCRDEIWGMYYDGSRLVMGNHSHLSVTKLGSVGVPNLDVDIDEFKAQREAEKREHQQLEFEGRLPTNFLRIRQASSIFCPSPSHLVCISDGTLTGFDFSIRPRITRRAADSTFDPDSDYIAPQPHAPDMDLVEEDA